MVALLALPVTAGAVASNCVVTESMTEPTCVVIPTVSASTSSLSPSTATLPYTGSTGAATGSVAAGSSSLPFTGADVTELAVIGGVAVLCGVLLLQRRRRSTS